MQKQGFAVGIYWICALNGRFDAWRVRNKSTQTANSSPSEVYAVRRCSEHAVFMGPNVRPPIVLPPFTFLMRMTARASTALHFNCFTTRVDNASAGTLPVILARLQPLPQRHPAPKPWRQMSREKGFIYQEPHDVIKCRRERWRNGAAIRLHLER